MRVSRSKRAVVSLAVVGALTGGLLTGSASAADWWAPAPVQYVAGAAGAGDNYYPWMGNGGYDVAHYKLEMSYDPTAQWLVSEATITASAMINLSQFNLDLRNRPDGLEVDSVTVDSADAAFERTGERELVITPAKPLDAGNKFKVKVFYHGHPGPAPKDADGFLDGWIYTDDGGFTANPPQGADTWFPLNNHPSDKATFTFIVTVPYGYGAISNGMLTEAKDLNNRTVTRYTWEQREPMAGYLATVNIGKWDISKVEGPNGIKIINATDPRRTAAAAPVLSRIPDIINFFSEKFGPYPFTTAGAIIDNATVGYAMEQQTRPEFGTVPSVSTMAHEYSHQWWGDAVSLHRMSDVWLNEGFATFSTWLWTENEGGASAQSQFNTQYAKTGTFWNGVVIDPGPVKQYDNSIVYTRGAMTLQALRTKVGDAVFFDIMKTYFATYKHRHATTEDFVQVAQTVSGQNLRSFFTTWLYTPGKPASW